MTTNITLYRKTNLQADKNFLFEDKEKFDEFISRNGITTKEVQFQKIQANLNIRLQFDQDEYLRPPFGTPKNVWDYCKIDHNGIALFYFVTGANWRAENTVELSLSLDVLNSFSERFINSFTAKTQITRQHKDRYYTAIKREDLSPNAFELGFKVDKFPEGITPALFMNNHEPQKIIETGLDYDQKYYLIYATSKELSVDNIVNPVNVYLSSKERRILKNGVSNPSVTYSMGDFENGKFYYFLPSDNLNQMQITNNNGQTITFSSGDGSIFWFIGRHVNYPSSGGIGYEIVVGRLTVSGFELFSGWSSTVDTGQTFTFDIMTKGHIGGSSLTNQISDIVSYPSLTLNSGVVADIAIEPFSNTVDRTSSRLMKIIEIPYRPTNLDFYSVDDIGGKWKWENGLLKLKKVNDEFLALLGVSINMRPFLTKVEYSGYPNISDPRDIGRADTKLQSSQFSSHVVYYDSCSKDFSLDGSTVFAGDSPRIDIEFKMSNSISSSFAFRFKRVGLYWGDAIKKENFYEYMVVSRNNEMPIYSSGFVDYIRSGYNYDLKSKQTAQTQQFAGLLAAGATSVITAAAASNPALAAAVGAASMISGIVNFAISERQSQDNIDRKLKELAMQSAGVSGASDVEIMDYYGDNKLWFSYYSPSQEMQDALNNLFFYYGYACNDFGVPDLSSRAWFNFIQCSPVFDDDCRVYLAEYITEIEERFKTGVTVFHPHEVTGLPLYDMYQTRENWENSILRMFES